MTFSCPTLGKYTAPPMGGRCSNTAQFAGENRLGSRQKPGRGDTMIVRVQGRAFHLLPHVPIADLMQRFRVNERNPRTFTMGGARLDPRRSLWQQGVRQHTQLEVFREPVPAGECSHLELQYAGSVAPDDPRAVGVGGGYELVCPDCDQRGVVSFEVCDDGICPKPSASADALIRGWQAARPWPARCRHPVFAFQEARSKSVEVDPRFHDARGHPQRRLVWLSMRQVPPGRHGRRGPRRKGRARLVPQRRWSTRPGPRIKSESET